MTGPWLKIVSSKDYNQAYKKGRKFVGKYLVIFVIENDSGNNRYGVVTSKKVGKAVKRNKAKRRLKALIGRLNSGLKQGYDIIFSARSTLPQADFDQILSDGERLVKKAGLT